MLKDQDMRRFYAAIESFSENTVTLDSDETRHLRDVLRLKVGDVVAVFDGTGREFACAVAAVGKKSTELTIERETLPASPESPFEITLAAAVLNGEKYDLIIQKAVELGVTNLFPLITVRCDVKVNDAAKRLDRWRRIVLDATKQSGRANLMRLGDPSALDTLLSHPELGETILFSERGGIAFSTIAAEKKITALIGPKGGWDDSELASAGKAGVKIITLGGRILRAETAAISIAAILQHKFGDLN